MEKNATIKHRRIERQILTEQEIKEQDDLKYSKWNRMMLI